MKKSQEKTPAGEVPPHKTRPLSAEPSTSNQSGSSGILGGIPSKGLSNNKTYSTPARYIPLENRRTNPKDNVTMNSFAGI